MVIEVKTVVVQSKMLQLGDKQRKTMIQFMILYNGPATPPEQMTKEQIEKVMMGWKSWMEELGDKMVDMGKPLANGKSIVDDGSEGKALELSGYSIIQAEDMDAALKLVENHPFLSDKTGKFSVEVFELMPQPSM